MAVAKTKNSKAKAKPVNEKKEKKESIFSKWRRAKSVGRNSGWNDAKKIPDVVGATTMAKIAYNNGHSDHKKAKRIDKRYNNKK